MMDADGRRPADYIVDIDDEDVQQEVLQILDSGANTASKLGICSKKTILASLLGV